jgi:hypothetical protein
MGSAGAEKVLRSWPVLNKSYVLLMNESYEPI